MINERNDVFEHHDVRLDLIPSHNLTLLIRHVFWASHPDTIPCTARSDALLAHAP